MRPAGGWSAPEDRDAIRQFQFHECTDLCRQVQRAFCFKQLFASRFVGWICAADALDFWRGVSSARNSTFEAAVGLRARCGARCSALMVSFLMAGAQMG